MIKLKDHTDKVVSVPLSWDETPTGLFQRYVKEWDGADRIKLFCIQTGYDETTVRTSTSESLSDIIERCTDYVFLNNADFSRLPLPKVVIIGNKALLIPKDIEEMTIEQNMVLKNAMAGSTDLRELISLACAVYLQPIYDNAPFDHTSYKNLQAFIDACPITDTYPIGFFLLNRQRRRGKSGFVSWRLAIHQLTLNAVSTPKSLGLKSSNHGQTYPGLTVTQRLMAFLHGLSKRKDSVTLCPC
jgi:hypothetical protein